MPVEFEPEDSLMLNKMKTALGMPYQLDAIDEMNDTSELQSESKLQIPIPHGADSIKLLYSHYTAVLPD